MGRLARIFAWVSMTLWVIAGPGCGGAKSTPSPTIPNSTEASGGSVVSVEGPDAPSIDGGELNGDTNPTFRILPQRATLEPGDPGLQLLVSASPREAESVAKPSWTAAPPGTVQVDRDGYVRPIRAGKAQVVATLGDESVAVEVEVVGGDEAGRPWDFAADIQPIFTRYGCNTGGCHGKADGQNGFHLSLFGYDPGGDYRAITREAGGRRIAALDASDSLLLRKATGETAHGGGRRIDPGSDAHRLLGEWIAAGGHERVGKTHGALAKVEVEPADVKLDTPGEVQLRVVAEYADGHRRDVTRLATYKINDESAASVSLEGEARLLRRAETDLIVRYGPEVVSTRLATVINPGLEFDFAALPRRNAIDEELFRRLESLKVPPSPPAPDSAFLRRVTLDLTGQQPSSARVKEFLKDTDPEKRAKKVDALLQSEDFLSFWQVKLGDMLQISQARFGAGAGPYQSWLSHRLEENAPWDVMVRELLTTLGDPTDRLEGGPANYALEGIDAKVAAELTAQRFLGLRLRCAQCHDHPFDSWTQDDYFGLAAIFAKVSRGGGPPGMMMGKPKVSIDPKGTVEHLRTNKPAEMRLLNGQTVTVEGDIDPRGALADWITKPDNPYFARAMANWTWAQFFGRGVAEPADDLSRANPPVHPALLDAMARRFVESKYDLRALIRMIATSEAYALSSATVPGNEHDTRLFSHHLPRPLTAHQMADALAQATDVPLRFGQSRVIRKAIEVNDPSVPSTLLDTFGRCPRTVGCSSVATPSLSLRQALLLIGGNAIDGKVTNLNGYLSNLLVDNPDPGDLVELLYMKALCRPVTPEESSFWTAELKGSTSLREAAEDLFWALLNSREFAFNH